jgi:hypothetical protein
MMATSSAKRRELIATPPKMGVWDEAAARRTARRVLI